MKINLKKVQKISQETFKVLTGTICNLGSGDYLEIKEQLFAGETVDSLFEKIKAEEEHNND